MDIGTIKNKAFCEVTDNRGGGVHLKIYSTQP
jgi:hypothetical protein